MCGRYTLTTPAEAMQRLFGFTGALPNWPARYNIAPTQPVPVVRLTADRRRREIVQLRWGLVPAWAKDLSMGATLINARAEGIESKPAFRAAFRARRCLVPADSFFEWRKSGASRTPYRIGLAGGTPEAMAPFAFAGLWERWTPAGGEAVESCTIVTTEANERLRDIHGRMPVILDPADFAAWLDPATPPAAALALLKPYPAEAMMLYPVSTRVNSVRFDDPDCIAAAAESGPRQPSLL